MVRSMGSQRVGHDGATEQQQSFKKQSGDLGSFLWISWVVPKEATFSILHASLRSFIARLPQSSSHPGGSRLPRPRGEPSPQTRPPRTPSQFVL